MPATMLLAEDSVTIRRIIELTFANEDVRIVSVGDGESAIQQIEEDQPDIVLADVSMPKLDGYGVASYLKQSPARREIPVLLLTGAFEPVDEDRARESRCDGILVKPFDPQLLLARVKELLAGRRGYMAPPADGPHAEIPAPETLALTIPPALEIVAHSFGMHTPAPPPGQSLSIRQFAAPPGPFAGDHDVVGPLDRLDPDEPAEHMFESDPVLAQQTAHGGLELEFDQIEAAFENRHPPEAQPRLGVVPDSPAWGRRPPAEPVVSPAADGRSDREPGRTARLTPRASLGSAFGALLAKEQAPGASPTASIPFVSEGLVEELVRRVLTRMTEDAVRRLVADTAERVLREEIDRIRRNPH